MTDDTLDSLGASTRALVEFADGASLDNVPDSVVERTKTVLLDTLGSIVAASNPKHDPGRKLAAFVEETGGRSESTVVGYGTKTSCVNAALANGTMGYYCDLDAHHPEAITHTPAVMVPTALAAGERESATGREFLVALLLGVEVACRVSLALNPRVLYARGFHPTAVAGGFGAAVSCGSLFDFDPRQYGTALGLVQTQASGSLAWKEEPTESLRPFNPGIAARNGVTAALLARSGFGSPVDPFEGEYSIFRALSDGRERIDELDRELGETYLIMEHAFKQYPSVAFSHTALDALLALLEDNHIEPDAIDGIEVRFPATGMELIDDTDLRSHSLRYLVAVATVERTVTIDDIVTDRTVDPDVNRMLDRIELVGDDALDSLFPEQYPSVVTITTDSRTYSKRIDNAHGTSEKPFDSADIEQKFRRLTEDTTTETERERIVETVFEVEELDEIDELTALLS